MLTIFGSILFLPFCTAFSFSSCGSNRYDPNSEFCCGKTVVPIGRQDLLCCSGVLVNNPGGNILCCGTQSYDPRREICANGMVMEYINVDRTVFQRPANRFAKLDSEGKVSSLVATQPELSADSQGVVAREINIPADPKQSATIKDVYGQDILNCNGKFHRLTDPSQYGFFSCCGTDVYNWLYYTCVNEKVVMVQDAPWPKPTRDASTDMKPVFPLFPPHHHHHDHHRHIDHHHHFLKKPLDDMHHFPVRLGFSPRHRSSYRHSHFPGVSILNAEPQVFPPANGCYARCGASKWYHLTVPYEFYRCCGDDLVDTTNTKCHSKTFSEPIVLISKGQLIGYNAYLAQTSPIGSRKSENSQEFNFFGDFSFFSPLMGQIKMKPHCERNKVCF